MVGEGGGVIVVWCIKLTKKGAGGDKLGGQCWDQIKLDNSE